MRNPNLALAILIAAPLPIAGVTQVANQALAAARASQSCCEATEQKQGHKQGWEAAWNV